MRAPAPPEPGISLRLTACEVGPLRLWSPVILAPMAGVTDAPFRRLCRRFGEMSIAGGSVRTDVGQAARSEAELTGATPGIDAPAGLYVTEMVTSRALVERTPETMRMIRTDPQERVRSIQLYGVDPSTMAQATRILIDEDYADHVDVNFGCPVPKVTRKGGGAALPWKRDLFDDLVGSVVAAADQAGARVGRDVPVTIKMRIGIDTDHETFLDAARMAQSRGVAGIGLHARTQVQHYSGHADWTRIAQLKDAVSVPVFGNGDVFEGADAVAMLEATGCDAVTVGRGCQGRPWLFRDLVAATHGCAVPAGPTLGEVVEVIGLHAAWQVDELGDERRALREMRKHIGWYLRGFAVGGPARRDLNLVSTLAELDDRLHALDLTQPVPAAAEGPRGRAGGEKVPHLPDGWLDSPVLTEAERVHLHLAEVGVSGG